MSAKVLGRVVTSGDRPRGPDVQMSVGVPAAFMHEGATLLIELPRNLACASCKGGGCDRCERAGAVSLRGRSDPVETVELTLPKGAEARALVVRLPDRGGLPAQGSDLPRGNLLLTIRPAEAADACVTRLAIPSVPPPDRPVFLGEPKAAAPEPRIVWLLVAAVVSALLAWFLGR
jgi:hypothetical protein